MSFSEAHSFILITNIGTVSWRAGRRKAHCRIQSPPPNVHTAEFSDSECLFTYSLLSGSCGEKEKGQTDIFTDLSNLAPLNSEMLNLWKGFVELVHYIDENKEWLDRELEICQHLKH